jgi:hypothetical protein
MNRIIPGLKTRKLPRCVSTDHTVFIYLSEDFLENFRELSVVRDGDKDRGQIITKNQIAGFKAF